MKPTPAQILQQIAAFCKHEALPTPHPNTRNPPFSIQKERELYKWIQSCSKVIMDTVIPNTFWHYIRSDEARRIPKFSQLPLNWKEVITMLILWSCYSPECSENITKCIQYGANVLCEGHLEWLHSLSICIVLLLKHATKSVSHVAKASPTGMRYL